MWLKAHARRPASTTSRTPSKTDGSYRGDYFTLGDVGYIDADGYLFLTDRSANLIISGGVNIYPAEVDAVLLEHPAVGDAATIGVPDEEWGESVKSVVELQRRRRAVRRARRRADRVLPRSHLAHFKCPRTVDFVDTLPRQDNGKIYKRRLKDAVRRGVGGDRIVEPTDDLDGTGGHVPPAPTRPTPSATPTTRSRDQLLDAASRVFAREGYDGTKILDIVREAGLSTGAVYSRFRSKNELLRAAVIRSTASLRARRRGHAGTCSTCSTGRSALRRGGLDRQRGRAPRGLRDGPPRARGRRRAGRLPRAVARVDAAR